MKRIGILLASFLAVVISLLSSAPVFAASSSLGVNPRRDYVVKSGETTKDTLVVTNLSKTDALNVSIQPLDFKPINETGEPSLLLDAKEPTKWSLKPYLSIAESMVVPAGKTAEVPVAISIPKTVGAGTYYSAIRYSAVGDPGANNVSLSGSSVTLMFVSVPGEAKTFLELEKFGAFTPTSDFKTGAYSNFFSATKAKYISYRLKNTGNVAEQPAGSMLLKNIFGKQVKLFENANPNNSIVLIGQSRRFDVCLNEDRKQVKDEFGREVDKVSCNEFRLAPGRYTADLSLTYGNEGGSTQDVKATSTFWYLPPWFIIAVAFGVALIAYVVWRIIKKIKHRNAHKFRGR